jgi:uncharacterized protein with LGFP repeats
MGGSIGVIINRAEQIKQMLDECYPEAIKVRLVMDNLNTHQVASLYETLLYETFSKPGKRGVWQRDLISITRQNMAVGSTWGKLNSVPGNASECLDRRIPDMTTMQVEVTIWQNDRNNSMKTIDWQFTTADARIKLKRLYPKL